MIINTLQVRQVIEKKIVNKSFFLIARCNLFLMTTTIEIAENALTQSIEKLKSSGDQIPFVNDIIKELENSRVLARLQGLLDIGYTTHQLSDIFQKCSDSDQNSSGDLENHYIIHSRSHRTKPEISSKCP